MADKETKENKETDKRINDLTQKIRENPWVVSTIVLGVFVIVLLFFMFRGGVTGNVISEKDIGSKAVEFINAQLLQGQGEVSLDSVATKGDLYEVLVSFQGRKIPAYFTKDGEFFVGTQLIPTSENLVNQNPQPAQEPKQVEKSDKPKVELFVMTHCPYGTQAEKGIIPAAKALGNKIDFSVRFVHYFMHGDKEEQETYRQVCIREEQKAKFLPYLECFLEAENSTGCLKKLGINVDNCVKNKSKEYYSADSKLSQGYGVQGSPTLVINGVQADFYPRTPENALKTICSAFNTAPTECEKTLSTDNPQPGFGTTSSPPPQDENHPSENGGSCGSA